MRALLGDAHRVPRQVRARVRSRVRAPTPNSNPNPYPYLPLPAHRFKPEVQASTRELIRAKSETWRQRAQVSP